MSLFRSTLTLFTLGSVMIFPWPFFTFLALGMMFLEPLLPLAVGILADALYYVPSSGSWPFFSVCGACASLVASVVQGRLRTGSIDR